MKRILHFKASGSKLLKKGGMILLLVFSGSCSMLTDSKILVSSIPGPFVKDMITLAAINGSFLGNEVYPVDSTSSSSARFDTVYTMIIGVMNAMLISTIEGVNDDSDYTSRSVYSCLVNIEAASMMATGMLRSTTSDLNLENHMAVMSALSTEMCNLVEVGKLIHINDDIKY